MQTVRVLGLTGMIVGALGTVAAGQVAFAAATEQGALPAQATSTMVASVVSAPATLKKIEPDFGAPHYRLNPLNYTAPLNPILVEEIRESLTPKMVNPVTGTVVEKLPLAVAGEPAPVPAPALNSPTAATPPLTSASNPNLLTPPALAATQDVKAALLKIDPSLKLDDQYVVNASLPTPALSVELPSLSPAASEVNPSANAASGQLNSPSSPSSGPTTGTVASRLKIMIPIHHKAAGKQRSIPAPSDEQINVTEIDRDITLIEGKARHYPTRFSGKQERLKAESRIKELTKQLDVLAADPRASYEVLLRAMKANVLARNMDAGPDAAFKSAVYFQRLLKIKPNDPETSFWYGFSLGEGGGFKESIPHLNNALKVNYQEAYLALAHSYLQMEDKKNALTMLNNYKIKFPTDAAYTDTLIQEIQQGKRYSIWQ